MKKIFSILLTICSLGWFAPVAFAHFPASDGSITVILHTDPDDNPIAGQPAQVYADVSDSTGKFKASNCNCDLIISQNNTVLFNHLLQATTQSNSIFSFQTPFTFPNAGTYHITISGNPKTPGAFQTFQVDYNIPVIQKPTPTPPSKNKYVAFYALIAAGLIICLGSFLKARQ